MKQLILIKQSVLFTAALLLSGCISTSGTSEYVLKPTITPSGEVVCCEAHVYNSKDYEKINFRLVKQADGSLEVTLDEEGVSASDPNAVQAENNAKLLDVVRSVVPVKGN